MSIRRTMTALVCLTLALGASACSDEDVSVSGGSPGAGGRPTSTPGGATTAGGESGARSYTTDGAGIKLSQDQVDRASLTLEDLGDGWQHAPSPGDDDTDASFFDGMQPTGCRDWFKTRATPVGGHKTRSRVAFKKPGSSRKEDITVQYTVASFDTPEKANEEITSLRSGQTQCAHYTLTTEKGVAVDGALTSIEFDRPGDDSVANRNYLHLSSTATAEKETRTETSETYSDTVRVQVGHNVLVTHVQSGTPLENTNLKKLVDAGFRRLENVTR